MKEKTVIANARLAARQDLVNILIGSDGSIESISTTPVSADNVIDAKGALLSAGLIDTHIHGIGGFGTDDADPSSILGMSEVLSRYGVTAFIPTLYAGSVEKMAREARAIVSAMGKEKGARILGINFEGPFLNSSKSGAQDKNSLSLPSSEAFLKLLDASSGHAVAMTVAPELEGVEEVAKLASLNNVVLLMGHTNAPYGVAKKAMDMGIVHATHMFNAMSPLNHKDPGVPGAVLFDDRCRCEIIADNVHVHKDLVCHVINTKPEDNVVLITDSLAPTTLGQGEYLINGFRACLGENGGFVDINNPKHLCGSSLTLNKAVYNVASWGIGLEKALGLATRNPALIYGLSDLGRIEVGAKADLVIFDSSMNAQKVFIGGNMIKG